MLRSRRQKLNVIDRCHERNANVKGRKHVNSQKGCWMLSAMKTSQLLWVTGESIVDRDL